MELTLLFCVLVTVVSNVAPLQIKRTFRDIKRNKLQNLQVHKYTGDVFLGATNTLFHLSPDLVQLQRVDTGPRSDNPSCPPPQTVCKLNKTYTNSFSQGITIVYKSNSLIACVSLYHGACQIRELRDISNLKKEVFRPLVPNNPVKSSMLFIGPGVGSSESLYIGATYSDFGLTAYRDLVPHISSRNPTTLNYAYSDKKGGTNIFLLPEARPEFSVDFVYGFSYGSFVYFVVTQPTLTSEFYFESRIIRLCQDDKYFNSYVEIPITCKENDVTYNYARGAFFDEEKKKLYIVFEYMQTNNDSPSAVCGYNMADTEHIFDQTVDACYKGNGFLGPEHITNITQCKKSNGPTDYCGSTPESKNYSPISPKPSVNDQGLLQLAIITFPYTILTSIAVVDRQPNVLLFLGSERGELKKVVLTPGNVATVVKEIDIEPGQEIKKEMFFNVDKTMLYVMTQHKLTVVNTKHCEDKASCEECTGSPDPVCGWCVMENRCTEQETCPRSEVFPHWLPSKKGACAKMVEVQPAVLSYENIESDTDKQQITFKLEEIMLAPGKTDNLACLFSGQKQPSKTFAIRDNEMIKCPLPEPQKFPELPEGKDFSDMEVEFQIQNKPIVKRSVEFYDCRVHVNCTGCTGSKFNCEWDYLSHKCMRAGATQSGKIITDSLTCPMIDSPSRNTDIVVHGGEFKQIAVKAVNLQPEQKDNLNCHFKFLKQMKVAKATLSPSNVVTCDSVQFDFVGVNAYVTADFRVNWGNNNYSLDNPTGIKVRIYKCPLMVTNCGQCLSLDQEYDCGWCGDECTLRKHCTSDWLDRSSATCPNPKILRFSPNTGPINGKTNISVTGINLGINLADIQSGVEVAGVRCHVLQDHFESSGGFRCETEISPTTQVGTIVVTVNKKYTAESTDVFGFVDPEVKSLRPGKGPKSGGSVITITGDNLDAGSQTTVTVGNSPCEVQKRNYTALQCMTSQHVDNNDEVQVQVSFGGYKRLLVPKFTYVEDPTITAIEPKKSILSGGITITVIGERLNLIQKAEGFVEIGRIGLRKKMFCHNGYNQMAKWLMCKTPQLIFPGENITETNPKEIHYGFKLDKVTTWTNVSRRENMGPLLYYPDPIIYPFPGQMNEKKYIKGQMLVIEGSFLIINQLMQDIEVIVGQNECTNPTASDTTITCVPPENPDGIDNSGNAIVLIQIGNFRQKVGRLNYYEIETKDKPIALGIILGVVLPIIAIIALLAFCIIRRQRKNGPNKGAIPDMLKDYDGKEEEEEIGMNHVSVKADMNGQIPDSGPYISDLLARIPDDAARQAISEFLIPRNKLDIGELVGKGVFGNTYQARYAMVPSAAESNEKKSDVAVKSLFGCVTDNDTMDAFLQQCLTLKDLQHPNVLPLIGLCLSASEEPHLVMPYLERGDVKTYIRDPAKNITVIQLLEMAQQMSEAMAYLEGIHVVHGNLAARNLLLTDDRVVKVTGFGVHSLYHAECCKTEERTKVISKWLAPETLNNYNFSHKTDMWSFGIVLWELLTRGVTPYPDVESNGLKQYLEGGHRLKKPRQCPESLYVMMLQCWTDRPNDRPTFQEVNDDLKKFLSTTDQDLGEEDVSASQPLKSNIEPGGSAEYLEVVG